MVEDLLKYLDYRRIVYEFNDDGDLVIGGKTCYVSSYGENGKIIDVKDATLYDYNENYDLQLFKFGGLWYYTDSRKAKLNELEYIGDCGFKTNHPYFIGIHGAMEMLTGSRTYDKWIKKAKWLGLESLGICETNTLAGAMKFQLECMKNDIKPIIGMTAVVHYNDKPMRIRIYAKDEKGWINMLEINKRICIDNNGSHIEMEDFHSLRSGLVHVIDPKYTDYSSIKEVTDKIWTGYTTLYYSFDTSEMLSTKEDNDYLERLKLFFNDESFAPVALTDAHYLERGHAYVKNSLNEIRKIFPIRQPTKQWFMSEEEYIVSVESMLKSKSRDFLDKAFKNLKLIDRECQFTIPLMSPKTRHLPSYKMTPSEKAQFSTNDELMDYIIEKGLQTKIPHEKHQEYRERINMELEVLDIGNVRDYFLILWDMINWARSQGILVGVGRGSAAGSLVSYLMDITRIDPIEYGLLFERFLNVGRVEKSLPDIDVDFSGLRRDEVKDYVTERYGASQFCDVGTYTNLKPKSLFKDLGKIQGIEHWQLNEMTKYWPNSTESLDDVLALASKDKFTKSFFHKHPDVINEANLLLMQPRSESIHACATIIVPDDRPIYHYIPVKYMIRDGKRIIVSQWEGGELEASGFLKEDLLGLATLDKYEQIINRIKDDTGDDIDLYGIPLNDPKVLQAFSRGDNSDIFQFTGDGISQLCREMNPSNIEDLTAANALYRPGPMENGFHKQFVKRKNGLEKVTYLSGCEEITKNTYGVLCYQEQIMQICQYVGGLTLVEADSIRKAMGKKDIKAMGKFVQQFKDHARDVRGIQEVLYDDKGNEIRPIDELWDTMLEFAKYAFNKSHAAAYAVTAYYGQWFKVYYPLQFWATAFSKAKEADYSKYLAEIYRSKDMRILPPQINISGESVVAHKETGDMYWSLKGVKGCGDAAYSQILKIRSECGGYSSFEHFLKMNIWKANKKAGVEGSKVNKTVVESLISAGAFDMIEGIEMPAERRFLLEEYRKNYKVKISDPDKDQYNSDSLDTDWFWGLKQKEKCGIAKFDYDQIAVDEFGVPYVCDPVDLPHMDNGDEVVVIGYVESFEEKKTKKGDRMAIMNLEHNFINIMVSIWPNDYKKCQNMIENAKGKIMIFSGKVNHWNDTVSVTSMTNSIINVLEA